MIYNFDENIDRKNSNCEKHDALKKVFGYDDLQGLWVADMDFKTPDFINNRIIEAAKKSVYGYSYASDEFYNSIINWQKNEHQWEISKDELFIVNGVVPAYSACIEAFCPNKEDEVIVQTPVYPPLFKCVTANKRKVVVNELKVNNGYYTMDLEDLKSKITKNTKVLCLCSPHNPVGRVWNKEELEDLAQICLENNIIIISDEIHSDITFKKFTPLASISEKIANITITLNSAGKTFNIAGLNTSYVVSKNQELLDRFRKVAQKRQINSVNFFGYIATKAAYEEGSNYVKELKLYLEKNIELTQKYLRNKNSKIKFVKPEATYLLWLNFEDYELPHNKIKEKLLTESKVALNDGVSFGSNGKNYFRINLALSKEPLQEALGKICYAF
ncbi:MalY/PatB family protein [Arcobacter sp. YIC-464]|uniref:MalY/PatB family protein n=1 Tax=Arcobacter sp. YIC-464 TaxID=3376631 RepID=UPI003C23D150